MHELSLSLSLVKLVLDAAAREDASRVTCVYVRLGEAAAVDAAALRSCFSIVAEGTCAAGARLDIVETPLELLCAHCDARFHPAVRSWAAQCPHCGEKDCRVLSGKEFSVSAIDVEK